MLHVGAWLRALLAPLDQLPHLRQALLDVEGHILVQVLLRQLILKVQVRDLVHVVIHYAILDEVLADLLAVGDVR